MKRFVVFGSGPGMYLYINQFSFLVSPVVYLFNQSSLVTVLISCLVFFFFRDLVYLVVLVQFKSIYFFIISYVRLARYVLLDYHSIMMYSSVSSLVQSSPIQSLSSTNRADNKSVRIMIFQPSSPVNEKTQKQPSGITMLSPVQ